MPGAEAQRPPADAVAPAVSDAALGKDYKGNGGYAGSASAPAPQISSPSPLLSMLIPASFSTANASLSAGSMFATQLLSQDEAAGTQFFAVYDEMVAAAQVKYMPSNATLPEPAPNNLFAKMLAETQNLNVRVNTAIQQAPKEVAAEVAAAAPPPVAKPLSETKQRSAPAMSPTAAAARYASTASHVAHMQSTKPVEEAQAVDDSTAS